MLYNQILSPCCNISPTVKQPYFIISFLPVLVCVFPDLDGWAVHFGHKHTLPECISEHLPPQSVRSCVCVLWTWQDLEWDLHICLLPCLLQIYKVKAAGESGWEDSREKVRNSHINLFLASVQTPAPSSTSSFPSCPLSLFHFPSYVKSILKISACCWFWVSPNSLSFSILKMFSDKKRVETSLEQCGLVNNRVNGPKQSPTAGLLSTECAFLCFVHDKSHNFGLSPWGLVEHSLHAFVL